MDSECIFEIGQLVEYRAWYDGDGAWVSFDNQVGIVLKVLAITNDEFYNLRGVVLFDVTVYWIAEGVIEVVPDLLLVEYGSEKLDFL